MPTSGAQDVLSRRDGVNGHKQHLFLVLIYGVDRKAAVGIVMLFRPKFF